ncbi:MAG: thioesterase [Bacteroidetes bacterium]|nr:MAG: thioesterase [Bacteroidota bacterium]
MHSFSMPVEVRWSDLDPNFHLRHSVYYDYGAYCRIAFMSAVGLTPEKLIQSRVGPILFREEAVFRREVNFGDTLVITASLLQARRDFSRYTIVHQLIKGADTLAATVTINGAWLNTQTRKLHIPDAALVAAFDNVPRSSNFTWEEIAAEL